MGRGEYLVIICLYLCLRQPTSPCTEEVLVTPLRVCLAGLELPEPGPTVEAGQVVIGTAPARTGPVVGHYARQGQEAQLALVVHAHCMTKHCKGVLPAGHQGGAHLTVGAHH